MSIADILNLLGSLGLFLVGMKIMSDALMDLAGNNMRRIMAGLTSNRFSAALTGFTVTGMIQSSSATTLMVVSFVNAGLLGLTGAIGVIMGANIGTTVTAWLIAVLGFKVSMIDISLPLMFVGFILSMRDDKRSVNFGTFIIGFALLFIGLDFMKNAIPDLDSNQALFEFIQGLSGYGFLSLLMFALLGTVLTLILQSSSATMAITLIAVSQGWLPFEAGCAIVLGENIGTTITANLAALVSGTNARRAALAHLAFNIIGVIWVLLLFTPFIGFVANLSGSLQSASPLTNPRDAPVGLAIFHTSFNIVNTVLLIGFVPQLASIVTRLISEKEAPPDEVAGAKYLEKSALRYPQTAIHAALLEVRRLYLEPVLQAVLAGVNIPAAALDEKRDLQDVVEGSRDVLTADYDEAVRTRLDPIYRELSTFSTSIQQKFTLEEQESLQLRNISYAARDALLIVGDLSQLKREIDRNMGSQNLHVQQALNELRVGLLEFLIHARDINAGVGSETLEAELAALEKALDAAEATFIAKLNRLLSEDQISAADGVSLFNSSGLVGGICQKVIRSIRHVSDAAEAHNSRAFDLADD